MEQRQLRLGDVLDDYCPRDRRVTNHAVVALVGDEIKLTRCTTCDTEHPYKGARVPPRRQTKLVAALSAADGEAGGPALQGTVNAEPTAPDASAPAAQAAVAETEPSGSSPVDSVRRPLIRATLERPEGTPPPVRQAPVFTARESGRDGGQERTGRKRRSGGRPQGQPNGNRADSQDGHQFTWAGQAQAKKGARPVRQRSANRSANGNRADRPGKGQSRSRGKGRSR